MSSRISVSGNAAPSATQTFIGEQTGNLFMPTGAIAQTYDRLTTPTANNGSAAALVSGTLHLTAIALRAGTTATNVVYRSGATAAVTPTNWWFALYDSSLTLLAQTADQTTTAWAANTSQTKALGTPQVISASGLYYVGIMVAATTVPNFTGITNQTGGAIAATPLLCGPTSDTGLTTTAPATATAIANVGQAIIPYAYLT